MLTVLKKGLWICYSPTVKIENKEFVWIAHNSERIYILFGVPQGSILSSLLLNM